MSEQNSEHQSASENSQESDFQNRNHTGDVGQCLRAPNNELDVLEQTYPSILANVIMHKKTKKDNKIIMPWQS